MGCPADVKLAVSAVNDQGRIPHQADHRVSGVHELLCIVKEHPAEIVLTLAHNNEMVLWTIFVSRERGAKSIFACFHLPEVVRYAYSSCREVTHGILERLPLGFVFVHPTIVIGSFQTR